jgi:hypothetical protein
MLYAVNCCCCCCPVGEGGALLVVPAALAGQMMAEITLHSNLSVLHYTGVARHSLPQ